MKLRKTGCGFQNVLYVSCTYAKISGYTILYYYYNINVLHNTKSHSMKLQCKQLKFYYIYIYKELSPFLKI